MKIGQGYDVHKLVKGRKLILGGVLIEYKFGLLGHSDADVLVHAIIDSLLGAMCMNDIGTIFDDKDEKYKNINSLILLKNISNIIKNNKYKIINIDSTVVLQDPKISKYIPQMKKNISEALDININIINIKATTEENLGFTGNNNGIKAMAVSLLNNIND